MSYSDDDFGEAIEALRQATAAVQRVAETIDRAEPIRGRIERQLAVIDGPLAELERILGDARDELL